MSKKIKIAASLICADFLNLGQQVKELEKSGIDSIEVDVMDGKFVPRIGLPPEVVKYVRGITSLPIDVHLMVENPIDRIKEFVDAGATTIIVHYESTPHIHRVLKVVKDFETRVGLALNPGTHINVIDYLIVDLDRVMLMAINPGILGHKLIPSMMNKISDLKKKLRDTKVLLEIDGGVTFESAPIMVKKGADILVCGSSTVFNHSMLISENVKKLHHSINK